MTLLLTIILFVAICALLFAWNNILDLNDEINALGHEHDDKCSEQLKINVNQEPCSVGSDDSFRPEFPLSLHTVGCCDYSNKPQTPRPFPLPMALGVDLRGDSAPQSESIPRGVGMTRNVAASNLSHHEPARLVDTTATSDSKFLAALNGGSPIS